MRRRTIIAAAILLKCCSCAFALNPTLDVSQYAHTAWKVSEGFCKGVIFSMAQTADGYLWIGTDSGLFRFDGVRSVQWQPPAGDQLPSSEIRSLLGARDGRLWIGTVKGLASWKEGKLAHYPQLDGLVIVTLLEDHEGTIWAGSWSLSFGRLCRIQSGNTECMGGDGRFGSGVTALYEDSRGNLWAGAITGLWRWKPGPPKLYAMPDPQSGINALIESDNGGMLVAKDSGITELRNEKVEVFPLPAGLQFKPGKLFRDRHGALWIGAVVDSGLLHIHQGKTDLFTPAEGVFGDLSGDSVRCFLEDREGSIWVATRNGLDRFRDYSVSTISIQQGLSGHSISSVLAAKDGSIWMGASNGLNQWRNGKVTVYRKRSRASLSGGSPVYALRAGMPAESRPVREIIDDGLPSDAVDSLFEDNRGQIWVTTHSGVAILKSGRFDTVRSVPAGIVFSITEGRAGNVWMSHQEGLLHLVQAHVVERVPWAKFGRAEPAIALRHDPSEDGLWLGFGEGVVVYFKPGQLTATYAVGEGLGSLHIDAKGTLWAATTRGLARIKGARVLMLTSDNGLPCNTVHWMMEGDADTIWLYTACGLVRIAQSELDAWGSNPKATVHATVFDSGDGVRSQQFHYGRSPIVAKAADGKLWFLPFADISVIDPHHLAFNKLPPPVHIEQVTADDKPFDAANGMRLPPRNHYLVIDYTALSLVASEKVRFRYKLDGVDRAWREVVNERKVQYSNLGPERYRFRVKACNNSGVWNEEGATLDFVIPPMWYQTNWFRALCVAAFLALLWAAYLLRVRQLEEQERRFRETVETMPALAFVARPDGYRTFLNKGWVEYTGMALEQASGFGWQAAIHPDDLKRVADKWRTAAAKGKPLEYEARLRHGAEGEYRWFQERAAPLRDKRGKLVKWCGVATDMEDRKRAEQLQADLAHTNRVSLLGELAASLSHELKQPITGSMANARAGVRWLQRDQPDVQEALNAIAKIERDGARATEIIDRLRALYKKAAPKREPVDVNEIIGEMAVMLRGEANRHGVSMRTDLAADLAKVTADRVQLQQVLMNLMLNAIEAMKETGGVLTVQSQREEQGCLLISVSDTGVGLPADKADQIFNAFFTTKPQGSGMGLAISRSIVESHGGRLWATPNDGRGATFSFTLPCEMAAQA